MPKYRPKTNCSDRARAIRPRQRSSATVSQRLQIAANLKQHESSPLATQTHGVDTSPADIQAPPRDTKEQTVQLPGPTAHAFAVDPPSTQPTDLARTHRSCTRHQCPLDVRSPTDGGYGTTSR